MGGAMDASLAFLPAFRTAIRPAAAGVAKW
jgi:hypothetical protein